MADDAGAPPTKKLKPAGGPTSNSLQALAELAVEAQKTLARELLLTATPPTVYTPSTVYTPPPSLEGAFAGMFVPPLLPPLPSVSAFGDKLHAEFTAFAKERFEQEVRLMREQYIELADEHFTKVLKKRESTFAHQVGKEMNERISKVGSASEDTDNHLNKTIEKLNSHLKAIYKKIHDQNERIKQLEDQLKHKNQE